VTPHVVAVNVAVVRTDSWARRRTLTSSGVDKRPVPGEVPVGVLGLAGDTICDLDNHGGPDRAVYAYSTADLAFWSAELGQDVTPGGVGENLTIEGVDCSGAVLGERWLVGDPERGIELVVRGPRVPCAVFAGFRGVPDLMKRFLAAGRPGCYLAVARAGVVRAGDLVEVLERPAHGVTPADVLAVVAGDRSRLPLLTTAREHLGVERQAWLDKLTAARVS
jgi:MOSC domain-containing protein YiiM